MIITVILVALAFLALLFLFRAARGFTSSRRAEDPAQQLRPVDVEAFRNLIDPDEEEFLRSHLPRADFRKIRRERLRAAVDYISCAAHNAAVLLPLAEAARQSPDPTTAQAAQNLIDNAIRLRLYAFRAIPWLYVSMIFPRRFSPLPVVENYERMSRQVARLGLQHRPREVSPPL